MFQSAFYSDLSATNFTTAAYTAAPESGSARKGSFARLLDWGRARLSGEDYRRLNPHLLRDIGMDGI